MLGAVLHTLNIRLFHDQLTYIVNHAADRFIFVDRSLLPAHPLAAADLRVGRADRGDGRRRRRRSRRRARLRNAARRRARRVVRLPAPGRKRRGDDVLHVGHDRQPEGRGVQPSRADAAHLRRAARSTALAVSQRDTVMAIVPMFHANAWGLPYASTLVGAKQVFPGNSLPPDRVLQLDPGRTRHPRRRRADDLDRLRCRCCRRASTTSARSPASRAAARPRRAA